MKSPRALMEKNLPLLQTKIVMCKKRKKIFFMCVNRVDFFCVTEKKKNQTINVVLFTLFLLVSGRQRPCMPPAIPPHDKTFSSKKGLIFNETRLNSTETRLNFCYFLVATTRSKCNSSQHNGMTANLGGLQIDSFHVDEIEKIKEENQKISRW